MPAATAAAQVNGDALAPAEQLDRALGDAGVELLADQPVRRRVVMPVNIDGLRRVVVEPDPPHPPLGVLVGLGRQVLQRRTVEFGEQVASADAKPAHRPGEPTLADAILDRIIHNAHRLQLSGDSLRKHNAPKFAAA